MARIESRPRGFTSEQRRRSSRLTVGIHIGFLILTTLIIVGPVLGVILNKP